jgi:uncharacterized protein
MRSRSVLWQRSDAPGYEWCRLVVDETSCEIAGTVVVAWDGAPWRIDYDITLDGHGRTRRLTIGADGFEAGGGGAVRVDLVLEADGNGRWSRDDKVVINDPEAIDCDLGFSPSTNTLPIRRLRLEIGERREIGVAWILFPSFEVVLGRQSYERLAEQTWRYRSGSFDAELKVDQDGLVDAYYEWRTIARS